MSKGVAASRNFLACLIPMLALAACGGDDPQVPSTLAPPTNSVLTGTVGASVTPIPTVTLKDQKGRGIRNVWVRWTAGAGRSVNDSSLTDATGLATSGGWILGPSASTQTLTATASQLPAAVFTADAKAGPVAALTVETNIQTAAVTTDVAVPPSVRAQDQFGNSVPGVTVVFSVATGGGSVTGAQQVTNAAGVATVGSWKLGIFAGSQSLRADVTETGANAIIPATAISAAAADFVIVDGNAQIGAANKRLCTSPSIAVRDIHGNGVGQVTVTFTPAGASGTVTNGTVVSSANNGFATVGAWNLGSGAAQTLTVTSAALPGKQLTFTASVGPDANFSICARFIGDGGTPRQRQAVTTAVQRWQRVIVGHVQTTHLNTVGRVPCVAGIPTIDEDVEDLLLFVQLVAIDGPRAIIGQASPCFVHLPSALTLMGFLQLDLADLELMETQGTLDNVVTHEIGHILGIGTLWGQITSTINKNLLTGRGTEDPFFTGAVAREQFSLLLSNYSGTPVPVENTGGAGTRDAHWRKSVFNTELMQGIVAPTMPMSRVTVGSLADLGYTVDLNASDVFSFFSNLRASDSSAPVGVEMVNDVADVPIWGVEKSGQQRLLRTTINPLKRK